MVFTGQLQFGLLREFFAQGWIDGFQFRFFLSRFFPLSGNAFIKACGKKNYPDAETIQPGLICHQTYKQDYMAEIPVRPRL